MKLIIRFNLSCLLRSPGTQAPQYIPPDSGPNQTPMPLVSELQALLSLMDWLRSHLSSKSCILLTPASYTGLPVLLRAVGRHCLEDQFYQIFTAFTDLQSVVLKFQVTFHSVHITRNFLCLFVSTEIYIFNFSARLEAVQLRPSLPGFACQDCWPHPTSASALRCRCNTHPPMFPSCCQITGSPGGPGNSGEVHAPLLPPLPH